MWERKVERRGGEGEAEEQGVSMPKDKKGLVYSSSSLPGMGENKALYSFYLMVGYAAPFGKTDFMHLESTWIG